MHFHEGCPFKAVFCCISPFKHSFKKCHKISMFVKLFPKKYFVVDADDDDNDAL